MEKIASCEFNLDSGCVEIRFADGTMLSIDCEAVEEVYDISIANRSELDWLIYNNPLEYAYHVLNGSVPEYLKRNHEHAQWISKYISCARRSEIGGHF